MHEFTQQSNCFHQRQLNKMRKKWQFVLIFLSFLFNVHYSLPTASPTVKPTRTPTAKPTKSPIHMPTGGPSSLPTSPPTSLPTVTKRPTSVPTSKPTGLPFTSQPTSSVPSSRPSDRPSARPTVPTGQPSRQPSGQPSRQPTRRPSGQPSRQPSTQPTSRPTSRPSSSAKPTVAKKPTSQPSGSPTDRPSHRPSGQPSRQPTSQPSHPSSQPTRQPTGQPSHHPTRQPTGQPTRRPSSPSSQPTGEPTFQPTGQPSRQPTSQPSRQPTSAPVKHPTPIPTHKPSTYAPTISHKPSSQPSSQPSDHPSYQPSSRPTAFPSYTKHPTSHPTTQPTRQPSNQPTSQPSSRPSQQPSMRPSTPTSQPSDQPTLQPSAQPTGQPSRQPTGQPSRQPTFQPTSHPSKFSAVPTVAPTKRPTPAPTVKPTATPTLSNYPTGQPSNFPTATPTHSFLPTGRPSMTPTDAPSGHPTVWWTETSRPTAVYSAYNTSGQVRFDPHNGRPCEDLEVDLRFTLYRNMSAYSRLFLTTPGLTSGPCDLAFNGNNLTAMAVWPPNRYNITFYEGVYTDNYAESFMEIEVVNGFISPGVEQAILIDRSNGLKRSCLANMTWHLSVRRPNLKVIEFAHISLQESYPKICSRFNATLEIVPAFQQRPVGLNISLFLPYFLHVGSYLKISMPGFTNSKSDFPLDNLAFNTTTSPGIVVPGYNTSYSPLSLSFNSSCRWLAHWVEGNDNDPNGLNTSYILLQPLSNITKIMPFWISINRFTNHLIPMCGRAPNYPGFTLEISTHSFYSNKTTFDSVNAIGIGCSMLNHCNGNGQCDYCHSKCSCYDGFGSDSDRAAAAVDNFRHDCSSRTCPSGPAFAQLPSNNVTGYHAVVECSNNGVCNRDKGVCDCFDGFSGGACEHMTCQGGGDVATSQCSGRGQCLTMALLARRTDALPLRRLTTTYERRSSNNFKAWDANLGRTCVCDSSWDVGLSAGQTQQAEYFGPFCQFRRCPGGDDPATRFHDETNCTGVAIFSGGDAGELGNLCHVDCSNRGVCDHQLGVCHCFKGYQGPNCGYLGKFPGEITVTGNTTQEYVTRVPGDISHVS